MISFWNRRELLVSTQADKIAKASYALQAKGIASFSKAKSPPISSTQPAGGILLHAQTIYSLYVHKKDEAQARYILKESEGES